MKQLKTTLLLLASIIWQGAQAQETSTAIEGIDPNDPFEMQKPQSDNRAISSLTANFSPGWITSEVETPHYGSHSWQPGSGFELAYRYIGNHGYGFALTYSNNSTEYDGAYQLGLTGITGSVVYGGRIARQWIASVEVGIGYTYYTDGGHKSQDGLATRYAFSFEYQLAKHFGIGIGMSNQLSRFPDNNYSMAKDKINGFSRLALNAGLHIYL